MSINWTSNKITDYITKINKNIYELFDIYNDKFVKYFFKIIYEPKMRTYNCLYINYCNYY